MQFYTKIMKKILVANREIAIRVMKTAQKMVLKQWLFIQQSIETHMLNLLMKLFDRRITFKPVLC
jgi:biotin carboxylase